MLPRCDAGVRHGHVDAVGHLVPDQRPALDGRRAVPDAAAERRVGELAVEDVVNNRFDAALALDRLLEGLVLDEHDLVEIADALADIQYVLAGAVHEFGLGPRFAELFAEVQRSNMSKACKTREEAEATVAHYAAKDQPAHIKEVDGQFLVYRSADNKVLKSVKFSPPDLKDILGAENIPAKRTDHGR